MTRRTILPLVTGAMLTVTALAACGDDDDPTGSVDGAADTTAAPATAATEPATTEPTSTTEPATTGTVDDTVAPTSDSSDEADAEVESAEPDVITVEMVDYGYGGLPDTMRVGSRLEVTNSSETELHELVAIRLPDDETRSVGELLSLPPEEIAPLMAAMPAAVLLAAPGGGPQIAAVGDGRLTEPGRYAIICAIPTGADPAAYLEAAATSEGPPDVPGGPPHFVSGMYGELVVEE